MSAPFQIFPRLPAAVEDALRASISRFGVLVPVVKDQQGRIVDGHHRSRIADELGVEYRVDTVTVTDDDEAKEMARTLNADRRHLTEEQRLAAVALLAGETVAVGREEVARHSPNAIAGALGVSLKTVQDDIEQLTTASKLSRPEKTLGQDGKVRPTKRASEPKADAKQPSVSRKAPLPKTFLSATVVALKAAESIERLTLDDRWKKYAPEVTPLMRDNLRRAHELLSKALDSLLEGES